MLFSRRKATAIVLATIGVVAFGTGLTSAAFAADTTPPGNVTGLTATPLSSTSIQLNWTNPADADLVGVRVCRNLGATAPTWPCGGVNVGKASHTFTDTFQIFPSTQYTYSVFAFDTSLNVNATGAHASATTPATVNPPPANVTGLTATPLAGPSVKLDWTNPADADFAGVRICRAFGSVAPTLPCGGVNVLKPTNTFTDSNALIPNTQYTYAVFAFDTGANAASGASATVTTTASVN
ncbi:MAG TPA: fibronectin type III domain-containing protein, partial [Jatrophihabitantaceae bacterium]|nr:fibronectin type III domain-containing protein [Jatrophihabitantaceae bacterium]